MKRTAFAAALVLILTVPVRAAFVRSVMDQVDTEPLFDSEYFLDLRGFSWARAWDDPWAASSGGYRINGASLDCCALLLDQNLTLKRRLTPKLEFRFRFTDIGDKDRQEQHHWLEIETDIGAGFSVEVFGEPAFRKEDADIGLGLRWRKRGWQARARRNAVDFNFNSRGSTTERYQRKPWTDELLLEAPLAGGKAWAALEADQPTRREIPTQSRVFSYRRTRAWAGYARDQGLAPRVEYGYEQQMKSDGFATAAAGISEESRRQAHSLSGSLRLRLDNGDELEPGAGFLVRAARTDKPRAPNDGVFYKRWEVQPWLRWRHAWSPMLTGELAGFISLGENRVRHPGGSVPEQYGIIGEAKASTGLDFTFSPSSRIGLYGNFDLDTPGKPWDGGSVRAMFLF